MTVPGRGGPAQLRPRRAWLRRLIFSRHQASRAPRSAEAALSSRDTRRSRQACPHARRLPSPKSRHMATRGGASPKSGGAHRPVCAWLPLPPPLDASPPLRHLPCSPATLGRPRPALLHAQRGGRGPSAAMAAVLASTGGASRAWRLAPRAPSALRLRRAVLARARP